MKEHFQEQLNAKRESLKFDNLEDGYDNFRKIVYEVADGILRKKGRNAARNVREDALCLSERKRDL